MSLWTEIGKLIWLTYLGGHTKSLAIFQYLAPFFDPGPESLPATRLPAAPGQESAFPRFEGVRRQQSLQPTLH